MAAKTTSKRSAAFCAPDKVFELDQRYPGPFQDRGGSDGNRSGETDLRPLLNDVVDTVQVMADKNRNKIVWNLDETLAAIETDPMRLRQIALNLLSNACKFTENGRITMNVTREDDGKNSFNVRLAVTDTGIGMTVNSWTIYFKVLPRPIAVLPRNMAAPVWD